MSSWRERALAAALAVAGVSAAVAAGSGPSGYPGIGRAATPKELAAWDIDVRPDFKGLPPGSGSVSRGQEVWEGKCSSCHGIFGESGEVFNPLVGGTTQADVESGHAARLTDPAYPGRTTLMKVSTVSTLWDYINRAMPWNAPKSLSIEEVYAVTAYLLNLGGVLPDDDVLSDRNIAEVDKRLPNRNGMTTKHALWPGKEFAAAAKPDVQGSKCMRDCAPEPKVASSLPDFARNAHGNLAEQNRRVGAQRGANTAPPATQQAAAPAASAAASGTTAASGTAAASGAAIALTQKHACTSCHGVTQRIVGPAFQDVARKHASRADLVAYLSARIRSGGSGVWGAVPMPGQSLPEADARAIAQWVADGAVQ